LGEVSAASETLLIFSDVHLGSDLDDRHANAPRRSASVDSDLVALLAYYRQKSPDADRWRIVIAGDFIDFIGMTIAPDEPPETRLTDEEELHGLGSAADHARQKLRRVAKRHADVFAALAGFVADGHALTLVIGNHDIEFHWDEVQRDFKGALLAHARAEVESAGARFDDAAFLERIEFNPWFFWRDGVAFIEHGHQYDPFCSLPHAMAPLSPLDPRRIARGFCDVLIRFVVRPTRGMRESGHEHVGIFHYLAFGAQLGIGGMAALAMRFVRAIRELFVLRRASFNEVANALRIEHERRVARFAAATRIGVDRLRALLALQVAPVTSSIRGILASLLLDRLAVAFLALTTIGTLAFWGGWHSPLRYACFGVAVAWAVAHRQLSRARSVDPAASMTERAAHLTKLFPAAFVVMGHTHAPAAIRAGEATYINVGSWAEQETDTERAARTHLVIHVTESGAEAQFYAWEPAGPRRWPT
jgi:UDP-2,3-diacylglucosamine pyrophosphatase LpxH